MSQVSEDFLSSLSVPAERQNPLLRQLLTEKFTEDFLSSLTAPSERQNPLLRQLATKQLSEDFRSSLTPPTEKQNPLLRQLLTEKFTEDFLSSLSAPKTRQNPLLRQLADTSQSDQGSPLSPPPRNSLMLTLRRLEYHYSGFLLINQCSSSNHLQTHGPGREGEVWEDQFQQSDEVYQASLAIQY